MDYQARQSEWRFRGQVGAHDAAATIDMEPWCCKCGCCGPEHFTLSEYSTTRKGKRRWICKPCSAKELTTSIEDEFVSRLERPASKYD